MEFWPESVFLGPWEIPHVDFNLNMKKFVRNELDIEEERESKRGEKEWGRGEKERKEGEKEGVRVWERYRQREKGDRQRNICRD